jgi:hypothetical protein
MALASGSSAKLDASWAGHFWDMMTHVMTHVCDDSCGMMGGVGIRFLCKAGCIVGWAILGYDDSCDDSSVCDDSSGMMGGVGIRFLCKAGCVVGWALLGYDDSCDDSCM